MNSSSLRPLSIAGCILCAVLLSLFQRFEMSHDSWGYWMFARIWEETGRTIVFVRSPLYVMYLSLFRWLGYPTNVDAEYIATTTIATITIFLFTKMFMRTYLALLAAILWIPFMQVAEPATQKWALALNLWAMLVRLQNPNRFRKALSYAFLLMAYMVRPSYQIMFLIFAVADGLRFFRSKPNLKSLIQFRFDWPIIVAAALYTYIYAMQSPHPWNNIWYSTSTWYADDGKKYEILTSYSMGHIMRNFSSIAIPDVFFTNKELFHGAQTTIGAIADNPKFVIEQGRIYLLQSISAAASLTILPQLNWLPGSTPYYNSITFVILIGILLGAVQKARGIHSVLLLFIFSTVIMVIISMIYLPNNRYLFPLIPVFLLSAAWYGEKINFFLAKITRSTLVLSAAPAIFLIAFSTGKHFGDRDAGWLTILNNAREELVRGEMQLMTDRTNTVYYTPMRSSYTQLIPLTEKCHSILSLENVFIAAFTKFTISNLYDVWEIPPFGAYNNSDYKGLTPDRIDCVFMSRSLENAMGMATNFQIRYRNFIKPYGEYLKSIGAKDIEIPNYGHLILYKE